jgi:hypothetical protein
MGVSSDGDSLRGGTGSENNRESAAAAEASPGKRMATEALLPWRATSGAQTLSAETMETVKVQSLLGSSSSIAMAAASFLLTGRWGRERFQQKWKSVFSVNSGFLVTRSTPFLTQEKKRSCLFQTDASETLDPEATDPISAPGP